MIAKTLIIQKGEPRVSGDMPPVEPEMGFLTDIEQFAFRDKKKAFIKNSVVVGNLGHLVNLKSPLYAILSDLKDGIYDISEKGITYEVKGGNNGFLSCCRVDDCYCDKRRAILTFAPKEKPNNNGMINNTGVNINSFIPPPLINTTGSNNAQEEPIKKYDNGASWAVGKFDPDHLKYQISNLDQEEKSAEEVKPDFEKQYHEDKLESRQRIIDSQYQEISALQEENKALKERLEMYLNSF